MKGVKDSRLSDSLTMTTSLRNLEAQGRSLGGFTAPCQPVGGMQASTARTLPLSAGMVMLWAKAQSV